MTLSPDSQDSNNLIKKKYNTLKVFKDLPDPRSKCNLFHKLFDIVSIAICGILSGADDWVKVASFGCKKEKWLRTFLELPNGIPSHDTFDRVFRFLDPIEFEKCFIQWTERIAHLLPGEVGAIDGKSLQGSRDDPNGMSAVLLVSVAFAASNQLILGQLSTDEKSSEIATIPKLLKSLDIDGCLVTIDAMGCQKSIAGNILDAKADYLLALKGNQERLVDEVDNFFTQAEDVDFEGVSHVCYRFKETNRGGQETREIWITNDIDWLPMPKDWKGLRSIMMVKTERVVKGKVEMDVRYYISSLSAESKSLKKAARQHWAIENSCLWVDVTYQEDKSRVRKDNGGENLSRLKRLTLNMLKRDTTRKASIATKRYEAALDDEYRGFLIRSLA